MTRASDRIVFLDSLRFAAAAAVLFQHIGERSGAAGERLVGLLSPGVFGVVLFFLLSGFVMPMSVGRSFDPARFAVRRVFRIYPLVLVAFGLVALAGLAGLPHFEVVRTAGLRDWAANLLLVQDYVGATPLLGVTWTLSLELAWYALFAAMVLWGGPRAEERLLAAFPVVLLGCAALSMAIGHRLPLARPGMIYAAALGCSAYRYGRGGRSIRRLCGETGLFMATMLVCNLVSFGHFRHPNITFAQAAVPWLVAPMVFLLVVAVPSVRESRLVDNRMLAWLGGLSFSTYLLHPFALSLAERAHVGAFTVPLVLVLTLALSVAGFRLVERPGQRLARHLTRDRQRMAAAPV